MLSVLSQILRVDRQRQRSDPRGGFSTPLMHEEEIEPEGVPVLVTNTRGMFILGKASAEHVIRCAFFECPVEEEGQLVQALHKALVQLSASQKWAVRCTSVQEAVSRLQAAGLEPKSAILPYTSLPSVLGVDPEKVPTQGYITTLDGVRMFTSPLPDKTALVFGAPMLSGVYTRVGDYVAVAILRADRAVMVVDL